MSMLKAIIAEDEFSQREAIAHMLKNFGYNVIEASNGKEALNKLKKDIELRVLITDLQMPVMDGFELIRSVRRTQSLYVYIIVVTSARETEDMLKALSLGADDYLFKPVNPEEFKLRLKHGLSLLEMDGQEKILSAMASMLEYRSNETGYHIERTSHYARIIGRDLAENYPELKLDQAQADLIARVCPLHDIGKVGIPDRILHKPGKLTQPEMKIMKTHVNVGADILRDVYYKISTPYFRYAYEIAMFHHERWDGKGYPEGLSRNEIPLPAHIMSLSDVYDALTSRRCYKEAFTHEYSKQIILNEKGSAFDPRLVDAFIRQEKAFLAVHKRFGV